MPTSTSQRAFVLISASVLRPPTRSGTITARVSAAIPIRPKISVAGASSRTAILMNMNDAPQSDATTSSITR